jgi:hypothetical protein
MPATSPDTYPAPRARGSERENRPAIAHYPVQLSRDEIQHHAAMIPAEDQPSAVAVLVHVQTRRAVWEINSKESEGSRDSSTRRLNARLYR